MMYGNHLTGIFWGTIYLVLLALYLYWAVALTDNILEVLKLATSHIASLFIIVVNRAKYCDI